mgnify:CR=1 FL=1
MQVFKVQGLKPLHGKIKVQGAKNAVLPLMCGALLIIGSADKLGLAFWPVLLSYLGLLAAAVAVIHWRRELRDFRAMVGDEDFFRLYPREAKREQRRQARTRRREARRKKSS